MNTQGIGLGLFICKMIVKEFGGVIFVRSELGQGSRFTFSMVLEKSDDDIEAEQTERHRTDIEKAEERAIKIRKVNDNQKKIMLVDDEPFNINALEGLMMVLGFTGL